MTTLAELTLEEQRLAELVADLRTVDKEAYQRASLGVFDRYREVHRQYAALARLGDVEALRRAAFLQWFSLVEPPFLTGVADLDLSAEEAVIELLERSCRTGDLDSELSWMLPYYAVIADWWFDAARAPALATFCIENRPAGSVSAPANFESADRGQLGTYWASLHRG